MCTIFFSAIIANASYIIIWKYRAGTINSKITVISKTCLNITAMCTNFVESCSQIFVTIPIGNIAIPPFFPSENALVAS